MYKVNVLNTTPQKHHPQLRCLIKWHSSFLGCNPPTNLIILNISLVEYLHSQCFAFHLFKSFVKIVKIKGKNPPSINVI